MSSAADTRKSFAEIHDAEAFFHASSNERAADAAAVGEILRASCGGAEASRVLDFGGGDGRFLAEVLEQANLSPSALRLSVVDPDETYLSAYVRLLRDRVCAPIQAHVAWPATGTFDVVLANHVLYYVPSVAQWLLKANSAFRPGGICVITVGSHLTPLGQLWRHLFALIGRPLPFLDGEDVQTQIVRLGVPYEIKEVPFRLQFQNSEENRTKFLRFLLGPYASEVAPHSHRVLSGFYHGEFFTADHVDRVYMIKKPLDEVP